jgi:hypothetical protein
MPPNAYDGRGTIPTASRIQSQSHGFPRGDPRRHQHDEVGRGPAVCDRGRHGFWIEAGSMRSCRGMGSRSDSGESPRPRPTPELLARLRAGKAALRERRIALAAPRQGTPTPGATAPVRFGRRPTAAASSARAALGHRAVALRSLGALVSRLIRQALAQRPPRPASPFRWTARPMRATVDLADKEEVYAILDDPKPALDR